MSHYSVAVFSHEPTDVKRLLAPYDEDVDRSSPFAVFEEDEECDPDPGTGKRGYWYNPNAKWDWWVIGGRSSGFLRLKENRIGRYDHLSDEEKQKQLENHVCDQAFIRDCRLDRDETKYRKALRRWEIMVEGAALREEEAPFVAVFTPEYYREQYGTKERYAEEIADFRPFAFVTAEGAWHETGSMGWFGCDNATRESRDAYNLAFDTYLQLALEQNLYITIVDCHI